MVGRPVFERADEVPSGGIVVFHVCLESPVELSAEEVDAIVERYLDGVRVTPDGKVIIDVP